MDAWQRIGASLLTVLVISIPLLLVSTAMGSPAPMWVYGVLGVSSAMAWGPWKGMNL